MTYGEWKFCLNENDFFYYREHKDNSIIKVYPVLSLSLLTGPKKILKWACEFDGEKVSYAKEIAVMFFIDMELHKKDINAKKMFNPRLHNYKKAISHIKKNHKIKNITY